MHNTEEDCWIIIDGKVYDVTEYIPEHPGGVGKIMEWAGKDASKGFYEAGHSLDAIRKRDEYIIGSAQSNNGKLFIVAGVLMLIALGFFYWHYF